MAKTLKYRVMFKFVSRDAWTFSVWYKTRFEASKFVKYLLDNINFRPTYLYIKIEEKVFL